MFAEITRILEEKKSNCEGVYRTIFFKDQDTGKFFMTYVNPNYRNSGKWEKVAVVGAILTFYKTKWKDENLLDADSYPIMVNRRVPAKTEEEEREEYKKYLR